MAGTKGGCRRPRDATLQRLVGRGISAVELCLFAAGLYCLLCAVPPQAWDRGLGDATAGAEELGLGWVRHELWSTRRMTDETDADNGTDAGDDNSTNATTTLDAMAATGGKKNSKDDDAAILGAMFLYWVVMASAYLTAFTIFRHLFPEIVTFYTTNMAGKNRVPVSVPPSIFGWVKPTASISRLKDLWKIIGLDQTMALQFPDLCLKICLYVAAPMIFITVPVNYFVDEGSDDLDFLSQLGTANLGQSDSYLWWAHAGIVWIVVAIVCRLISDAEVAFVEKRFAWMKALPEPRATTLMVENIPAEYQSDAKLLEIFAETLSEDEVKSAHTVKVVRTLKKLVAKSDGLANKRKKATFKNKQEEGGERELVMETRTGESRDAETYFGEEERKLDEQIQAERQKVLREAERVGGVNTSTGFVTFRSQSSVAAAYSARVTKRTDEFVMSFPPDPEHVHYDNLCKDPDRQEFYTFLGYGAIFFIFFFFLFVITSIVTFSGWLQTLDELAWAKGILQAVAGPLVYQTVVGFLPTIFRLIFETFWVCPSEPYVQGLLYRWYFWFLYVFVLFMSVIGSNPILTAQALAKAPESIPTVIADKLPNVSNFYVSLIILQVSTHLLNMVRHVPLMKYLGFRAVYGKKDGKKMAEPEDQDYYGVGSRSARWINTMMIGIVYCQIQPILLVYAAVHFLVCKFVYGHLIVFAETRKSDIGGGIFQDQLYHLHLGLATYIVLMTGYLMNRSVTRYIADVPISPAIISFLSLFYLVRSARKMSNVDCEVLPRREVPKEAQLRNRDDTVSYIQPELLDVRMKRTDDDGDWASASEDSDEDGEDDDTGGDSP
mmetsp:Transcript_69528/g.197120  ORF Transcript_69528/g.197120 Transcript_69528/m.197120 type:complete len:834 (+) Transcript_69528:112-2613(+)